MSKNHNCLDKSDYYLEKINKFLTNIYNIITSYD